MDSEDKRTVWLVAIIANFVIACLVVISFWHIGIIKQYVNAGYTRTTLPGASCTYWVKPEDCNH